MPPVKLGFTCVATISWPRAAVEGAAVHAEQVVHAEPGGEPVGVLSELIEL